MHNYFTNERLFNQKILIAVTAFILLLSGNSNAGNVSGSFAETGIGARTLGLGNAYVGIADDVYSLTANPAGLALMKHISGTFDYANLYGLGLLKQSFFGLAVPTQWGTHGFYYQGLNVEFSPFPQKLSESTLGYAYAKAFGPLAIGTAIKYMDLSSDFAEGTATGFGIDLGIRYQLTERISLGGMIRDLYATTSWGTGTRETIPASWRFGAGYRISDRWLASAEWGGVSGDYFSRFRAGTEYWIMRPSYLAQTLGGGSEKANSIFKPSRETYYPIALAVRTGFEKQFTGDKHIFPAIGTTLGFGSVRLDYAYIYARQGLGETNRFSLTYDFTPWEVEQKTEEREKPSEEKPAETQRPATISTLENGIAVLDFANATGNPELGWLELGLADIVSKEVANVGLPVISRSATSGTAGLTGPEILTLAQQVRARYVVRGLFVKNSRGNMVLTARFIDAQTGRTLDFIESEAGESEIFVLGKAIGQGVAAKAGAWFGR